MNNGRRSQQRSCDISVFLTLSRVKESRDFSGLLLCDDFVRFHIIFGATLVFLPCWTRLVMDIPAAMIAAHHPRHASDLLLSSRTFSSLLCVFVAMIFADISMTACKAERPKETERKRPRANRKELQGLVTSRKPSDRPQKI